MLRDPEFSEVCVSVRGPLSFFFGKKHVKKEKRNEQICSTGMLMVLSKWIINPYISGL